MQFFKHNTYQATFINDTQHAQWTLRELKNFEWDVRGVKGHAEYILDEIPSKAAMEMTR